MAKRNSTPAVDKVTEAHDEQSVAAQIGMEDAELEAAVTADHNPNETARERLARLEKETAAQLAEAKQAVKDEEKRSRGAFVSGSLLPAIRKIIADTEASSGLTMRNLTFRYNKPGDEEPEIWTGEEPMQPGDTGIVVRHRLVRARVKD